MDRPRGPTSDVHPADCPHTRADDRVRLAQSSHAWTGGSGELRLDKPSRSSPWLTLGGVTAAALTLAVALAGGTHVADIWNGLVVRSVQFSQLFTWPVDANPVVVLGAALSLAVCVAYSRVRVSDSTADLVRIGAGLFILLSILLLPSSLCLLRLALAWIATRGRRREPNQ